MHLTTLCQDGFHDLVLSCSAMDFGHMTYVHLEYIRNILSAGVKPKHSTSKDAVLQHSFVIRHGRFQEG